VLAFGGLLYFGGCLSKPRDYSSPSVVIRLVDGSGSPVVGVEVGRSWYDSDRNAEGHDKAFSDTDGLAKFAKISASIGVFTSAGRKVTGFFASCGPGSGTSTDIYVRYHGLFKVTPRDMPLHPVGQSNQDPDGVWFYTSRDSNGNTLANLTFPQKMMNVDYALVSTK
jgi:hypothetical protein